jgi:hypothetical protein
MFLAKSPIEMDELPRCFEGTVGFIVNGGVFIVVPDNSASDGDIPEDILDSSTR